MAFDRMITKIKRTLGYPIVPVELLDDDILAIIQDACEDLYEYSSDYEAKTLPFTTMIDLTTIEDLALVRDVQSASNTSGGSDSLVPYVGPGYIKGYNDLIDTRMIIKSQQRLANSLTKPLSWRVVGKKLMIDAPTDTSSVTVLYVKKWEDESELDSYWNSILTKYATAKVHEVVGRARSKYKSSEGLYEVDASMLDSAQETINTILEELRASDILMASEL